MTHTSNSSASGSSLTVAAFTRSLAGRIRHFFWLYLRNAKRAYLAWRHRDLAGVEAAEVSAELRKSGLVVADAARFLSPAGQSALADASANIFKRLETEKVRSILDAGVNETLGKDYLIHVLPTGEIHDADSPFLRLALDPKLLNIISTYCGLWPRLHSIASWLNFPTPDEAKKSQLWHRDPEDHKFLKVFIYLEDVGERNGPFSYIPQTQPFGAKSNEVPRHEHIRRITDEEMAATFPESSWVKCVGPANTLVIADTVGFHRGGYVQEGRRLLITFTYTSGTPKKPSTLRVSQLPDWAALPIQKSALQGAAD